MVDRVSMYVGGRHCPAMGGEWLEIENPADSRAFACVPRGAAEDVDQAVEHAQRAQFAWASSAPSQRAAILERLARMLRERLDDFIQMEVRQTGRPLREMQAQLARLPEWYEYFAAVARTHEGRLHPFQGDFLNYTQRRAIGVVGLVTPWNHPLLILTKKLAPALAAGNTVVAKPSELAPITVVMLAELFTEAGLPAGVFNVVTGLGAEAGKALCEHPGIAKVDVTGGTETGRHIGQLAGAGLKGFAAELGGKGSVLVFNDADVRAAVSGALFASFIATGQTCVQGARILVEKSIYSEVVEDLVLRTEALRLGDPLDPATQIGPLVSRRQMETVLRYIDIGKQEGATLSCGGERATEGDLEQGYYVRPTVFTNVSPGMRIDQEEIFGPVACVLPFDGEAHAVELANATPFGLAGSVWTGDIARAHRLARQLDMGIVWVNTHHRIDPSSPWGGFKDSGVGGENGIAAYESYTRVQSVVVNTSSDPFDWFAEDGKQKRYS